MNNPHQNKSINSESLQSKHPFNNRKKNLESLTLGRQLPLSGKPRVRQQLASSLSTDSSDIEHV
jgi:hypothetical protein